MPGDLEQRLDLWESEGLISRLQHEAILQRERRDPEVRRPAKTGLPMSGWRAELFVVVFSAIWMVLLALLSLPLPESSVSLWLVALGGIIVGALLPLSARSLAVLWDALALAAMIWFFILYGDPSQEVLAILMAYLLVPIGLVILLFRFDRLVLAVTAGGLAAFLSVRIWLFAPEHFDLMVFHPFVIAVVIAIVAWRVGLSGLKFWKRHRKSTVR